MDDITKQPPVEPPMTPAPSAPGMPPRPTPQPIEGTKTGLKAKVSASFHRRKKAWLWGGGSALAVLLLVLLGGFIWYQTQLSPVNADNTELIRVDIASGTTPNQIAAQLEEAGLIRSAQAFSVYTRITGTQNGLQAGTYRLSPSESTPKIVDHLQSGKVDTFNITFLPGATLEDNREVLLKAGYSAQEIDAALNATYDRPLFAGKPSSADLEGYIFGETYSIGSGATVQDILEQTFAQFEQVIEQNNLVQGYQNQGLNLYKGIIMASIIQRESGGNDQPEIAQIFLKRLEMGMKLDSDVTYQYIADKTGVPRDVNLDSLYNTRRYPGLPPGPIAAPGVAALQAVANPADTDYLFFLSGDDDVTYYGRTLEDHEANIRNYCQEKCQII